MDFSRYTALQVETADKITTITINRPEARNAINAELHHEFTRIWPDVDSDPGTDVIVLQGSGGAFCAGGDLKWLVSIAGDPVKIAQGQRADRRITDEILTVEKPIIAKVDGPAVGLGCSLALFCDFVYATERSFFADPHVSVGLVAGDGGALLWPQLVGYARARRYLLTGDPVPAADAAAMGLITQSVADSAELDAVADAMARRMLTGAKQAIQFTKASINAGLRQVASAVVDRAAAYEGLTMMTEDFRIALDAFAAKERPVFKGI
jgi:enoyl-CoA hydratase